MGEFRVDGANVWLGRLYGCDFFMSASQFAYWQHTQLTVNVVPDWGTSFSLEILLGVCFLICLCLFTEVEEQDVAPIFAGDDYPAGR